MKTSEDINTTTVTSAATSTATIPLPADLEELAEHLVEALRSKFPTGSMEDYQVEFVDHFGDDLTNPERVLLELPYDILENEQAMRAVATILHATGSEKMWAYGTSVNEPSECPLRFSYMKRAAWAGSFMRWTRYLMVDTDQAEFDAEASAKQVAALIALLSDERNLVPLGEEDRSIF